MTKIKNCIRLMRVHHYIKNGLIFLPLFFSGNLFHPQLLLTNLFGFIAYSLTASSIYIINDTFDAPKDRLHPVKCKRPIASGAVSTAQSKALFIVLLVLAAVFEYLAAGNGWQGHLLLALYFVLNIGYSFGLKNYPLVDITILVSGFLIRMLYGSAISGIEISNWLYLTVISVSFYLALGKRRNEILKQGDTGRKVLKHYNHNFLDKNMYMCLALAIVFYSLWSTSEETIRRYSSEYLIWTVPVVLLLTMRYSFNIEKNSYGDPTDVILHDKVLLGLGAVYGVMMIAILYL